MRPPFFILSLCGAALVFNLIAISSARAVTLGQIDNFEDGTVANWGNGGTMQPMNISTGGPLGLNDNFMQITADGSGANGRLTVFNRSQWLGNYITAGVTEIDLDLKNFSGSPLSIRLAFKSATFSGAPGYLTTTPFQLAANSGWQHAVFLINPAALTAIGSPSPFSSFFAGPAEFRIINETGATDLNGDVVVAQLGIDNIVAVPEPASVTLLLVAGVVACSLRKRAS